MAEPGGGGAGGPTDGESSTGRASDPDEVLGWFKDDGDDADEPIVNDGIGGQPRMFWNPVTDAGGTGVQSDTADEQSFQFDLGSALARLDGDESPATAPAAEPSGRSAPASDPAARHASPTVQPDRADQPAPLPTRGYVDDQVLPQRGVPGEPNVGTEPPATTPIEPVRPQAAPRRSVFDDDPPPTRTAPTPPAAAPVQPSPVQPAVAPIQPAPAPVQPPAAAFAPAEPTTAPPQQVDQPQFVPVGAGVVTAPAPAPVSAPNDGMPFLPKAAPAAAPPMGNFSPLGRTEATSLDVAAARKAQLKNSREQRKGKLFGRTVLALMVIGVMVAVAMLFGRSYLFPTDWDPELVDTADAVQLAHGADFDHTVELVVEPADEYVATVTGLTLGDTWVEQVPAWRALGLATGEPTSASVGAALAARIPVVYDPATDTIYRSADAVPASLDVGFRLALETAYAHQMGTALDATDDAAGEIVVGFAGVSPQPTLIDQAIDAYLASRAAGPVATATDPAADSAADPASDGVVGESPDSVPIPLAYQFAAIEALGEPIVLAGDLAADDVAAVRSDGVYDLLDDDPTTAAFVPLSAGDVALTDPIALGVDDWSLVWDTNLTWFSVEQIADVVTADSFRLIERAGTTCAAGVFETATAADGASVFAAMQNWAVAAPAAAQATATLIDPLRVQLLTCDPGAEQTVAGTPGTVDDLIDRQIERINAG